MNSEMSAFHRRAPVEDPSCLTHGDYYDNLSCRPQVGRQPGRVPWHQPGVGSGWSGTPGSDLCCLSPPGPSPVPPAGLRRPGRSLQSGLDGGLGGGNSESQWGSDHRSSQRVSPGLPSLAQRMGPSQGLLSPGPLLSQRLALEPAQSRVSSQNKLGCGVRFQARMPKPTVDPQPWFQDGPNLTF